MLLGLVLGHAAPPATQVVAGTPPGPVLAVQDRSGGGLEGDLAL